MILTLLKIFFGILTKSRQNEAVLIAQIEYLKLQLNDQKKNFEKPKFNQAQKSFMGFLSMLVPNWKELTIRYSPQSIIDWRKKAFKIHWKNLCNKNKSKSRGRPTKSRQIINLIKSISKENPLWGNGQIAGQLHEIGFDVCENTVKKYKVRHESPRYQNWFTFLRNSNIASIDMFSIPCSSFKQMFAFVIIKNNTREIVFSNATYNPNPFWLARQLLEAFPYDETPEFLLRDNDANYGPVFKHHVTEILGMKNLRTQYRSPWQNPYIERLIGTIRRECTDHILFKNPRHLSKVLNEYAEYYNTARPHQSLGNNSPISRHEPENGRIVTKTWLNGLHTSYHRVAT